MDGDPPSLCAAVSSGDSELVNGILASSPPEALDVPDNVRRFARKAYITVILTHLAGICRAPVATHSSFALFPVNCILFNGIAALFLRISPIFRGNSWR
jgi:hypothetical protein